MKVKNIEIAKENAEVIYARTRYSFPVRHSDICETSFELCIGKNLERIPGGSSISRCCDSANLNYWGGDETYF